MCVMELQTQQHTMDFALHRNLLSPLATLLENPLSTFPLSPPSCAGLLCLFFVNSAAYKVIPLSFSLGFILYIIIFS